MRTVYTAIFFLLAPVLLIRIFWRGLSEPSYRYRWRERFAHRLPAAPESNPIWIHAVSVGETVAATPIVDHLRRHYPAIPILVTTTTPTGAATVRSRFGDSVSHAFFPYDLPAVVSRYMSHFNPRLLILMETELWPNLLHRCRERRTPVLVANARLSQRSASRYRRFPSLAGPMLAAVDCFATQGISDRERFISLGADPNAIVTTGSLKFDIDLPPSISESGQARRRFLGTSRAVVMAGSTREGEEAILLQAFAQLRKSHPGVLLVIAPRHPERSEAVAELFRKKGYRVARHSRGETCTATVDLYLVDSIGELPSFYAAGDVSFVGGSMVPRGGHNVLEPAALGVPVVVGPHTYNFSDIVKMLQAVGALRVAGDGTALVDYLDEWLRNSDSRDRAGAAGKELVLQNRGAAAKIMRILDDMISASAHETVTDATLLTEKK